MPPAALHPKPPFARALLSLCLLAACHAAFAADNEVALKSSPQLSPRVAPSQSLKGPTFLEADEILGHVGKDVEASGKVVVHNLRERLEADWLRYDRQTDEAHARGNVMFEHEFYRVYGRELKLKLSERLGSMSDVHFELSDAESTPTKSRKLAWVGAETLHFQGPDRYQMDAATYTTCPPEQRDWVLKTQELKLDYTTSVGTARNVWVEYLDKPILYAPWLDFALDDRRKSGFLAPSYGASSERGLELVAPWYWNIAPNRDATIIPRIMTQRGVQLGGEFRYLEPGYKGDIGLEFMPYDRTAKRERYLGVWRHEQQFGPRWSGSLDVEGVSDDRYFSDLSNQVNQTSQVNMPRQLMLNYDAGWLQARGLVQAFQTLQDPAAPIFEPYRRLPQLTLQARRERPGSLPLHWDLGAEFVHFDRRHNSGFQGGVQGHRLHLNPSISAPIQTSYATLTPKLGWYFTRYDLDDKSLLLRDSRDPASVPLPVGGFANKTRSMPMFSLDSGLVLERDDLMFGQNFIQTLEPRVYYLYIPYRDQYRLPVFDTGIGDLSLDQLFSENQYIGVDRINDANQLTIGLTSRFLDQRNGRERLAVTLGQRYYFNTQRVTFPGQNPRSAKSTDLLTLVSGQVNDKLRLAAGVQYNTDDGILAKANLGGSWREGAGRVFNVDYRYTNKRYAAPLNQVDLSAQWPLAPKWYGLGRINYSMLDSRLVEGLVGVEYNAGCWSLRSVIQRLRTTENTVSNAFFLQLELRGLTKLGPNPLDILKRSISGYAKSDEFDLP